ncbi:MAG: hypothetical protein SH857_09915 [Chitinophagales bacterium]|nr:hypothetical protein [Chitinophagales bacterium]
MPFKVSFLFFKVTASLLLFDRRSGSVILFKTGLLMDDGFYCGLCVTASRTYSVPQFERKPSC